MLVRFNSFFLVLVSVALCLSLLGKHFFRGRELFSGRVHYRALEEEMTPIIRRRESTPVAPTTENPPLPSAPPAYSPPRAPTPPQPSGRFDNIDVSPRSRRPADIDAEDSNYNSL